MANKYPQKWGTMKLPERNKPVLHIPAPVKGTTGLGDVVKAVTRKMGFRPCGGCNRRAARLNRWVAFTPRGGKR